MQKVSKSTRRIPSRLQEVQQVRGDLERKGFPRLMMFFIVAITGVAGFLSSYGFFHVGLTEMWVRYLVSVGIAYLVFFLLLWLWLRISSKDYNYSPDISDFPSSSGDHTAPLVDVFSGDGGHFGGGGASGSFDGSDHGLPIPDLGSHVGDAIGSIAEAEELAIPLVIIILLGVSLLFSCVMIYSVINAAPLLFAELIVDGLLAGGLYRRLRRLDSRHWVESAFRRTILPFAITAILVTAGGWGLARYVPGATSVGAALHHLHHNRNTI